MTRIRCTHQVAALVTGITLMTCALSAQAQSNQFSKADEILSQLESLVPTQTTSPGSSKPESVASPIVKTEAAPPIAKAIIDDAAEPIMGNTQTTAPTASVEITSSPTVVAPPPPSRELQTRLSEVPPNARFEFSYGLRIPAYKKGVVFVQSEPRVAINNDGEYLETLARQGDTSACALLSSRSYVQMRGADNPEGKAPTFLSVEAVRFMQNTVEDQQFVTAEVAFKEKSAKDMPGHGVDISVICRLPSDVKNPIANYQLQHFNDAVGGLFNYRLPQYIEI